ncbi:hypothetical protein [Marinobacter pelagius]|uniref:Uncharacterized protein n=1 Tax=Marinobacter pelagius TaxID=379482 RepID=A0A1I4T748_9GAMM|nr:hypothetical protein [Marinobacter pelagius]SFM72423.1 hypothetical protein SAMN04487961_1026 [Marinobacter pelagius]
MNKSQLKEQARKYFEAEVIIPKGYSSERNENGLYVQEGLQTAWRNFFRGYESAYDVARAQGGQGAEPADSQWLIQMRGDYLTTRGVWERPDHRGYTNDIHEAGRYSEAEAKEAERMLPNKCKAVRLPVIYTQPQPAQALASGEVEPVAWVSPALYGSKLTFQKPEPPEGWEDYADDWYCRPLIYADTQPQPAQQGSVPEGFALVPQSMLLSYEDIENIMTMTGWNEGRDDFGEGVLWVGNLKDDDGNETYGLNISCIEVMEEGALPVNEFERPALKNSAESHEWVRCDERLPTDSDADCEGRIWLRWPKGETERVLFRTTSWRYLADPKDSFMWARTGLKRPQPTAQGGG